MNANNFITCTACDREFVSAFAGSELAIGCLEQCPYCQTIAATPYFSGGRNIDVIRADASEPMSLDFGEDGSVFMGRGHLASSISHQKIVPVYAAYRRAINDVITQIESYYQKAVPYKQIILRNVYKDSATAYEQLTTDLFVVISEISPNGPLVAQGAGFKARRICLFQYLDPTGSLINANQVRSLEYLYAFRNCLAHRSGNIDAKLLEDLSKIGLADDNRFALGGPLVIFPSEALSFVDSIQHIAHAVLQAAQNTLTGHES